MGIFFKPIGGDESDDGIGIQGPVTIPSRGHDCASLAFDRKRIQDIQTRLIIV